MAQTTCSNCDKPAHARGYCSACYANARRAGEIEVIYIRDDMDRFWSKVDRSGECWMWTGRTIPGGYGAFNFERHQIAAHRWLWTQMRGPLTDDVQLDHLCRVTACVRLDHLEPVTPQVNTLRGVGPSAINAAKTHCDHGHEFTAENTYHHNGRRQCRTCRRLADQASRRT